MLKRLVKTKYLSHEKENPLNFVSNDGGKTVKYSGRGAANAVVEYYIAKKEYPAHATKIKELKSLKDSNSQVLNKLINEILHLIFQ